MTPKKIHIDLPLRVPNNIIRILEKYRQWSLNQKNTGLNKDELLKELDKVCSRWHLSNGYDAIAGRFWIYTKVGVILTTSPASDDWLKIYQCTRSFDFDCKEMENAPWDKEKTVTYKPKTKKLPQTFVYHFEE